ncbi:ABC transporter ATP-binding protein [Bacillus sp. JCM 19041]|uniref:ATP-binding cassette domain-containing protein n=1 Tax=Bacillus sp. JCM 19041 TaxID=1460637 RepID=UPI0006D1236F
MKKPIRIEHVSKKYKTKLALDNVSFSIDGVGITGLIGANGAGKTTLLQLLAGEIRASKGEVVVFEKNPFVSLIASQSIFFFRSDTPIAPTMTVKRLFKQMKRFYPTWNNELAEKLIAFFQISPNALFSELSTGKASLIRGLVGICVSCPLTIFDEPTLGMDESTREEFYRALLKSYLLNPRAIIISTHYISEVDKLCDHLLVINKGKLLIS